mmetsp:Transcript_83334/g.131571  ORF Transcript_83334/g.131571 Transcript_83334/m.131571 type:complete len:176 (-) Transcript_83334:1761-2288(-)
MLDSSLRWNPSDAQGVAWISKETYKLLRFQYLSPAEESDHPKAIHLADMLRDNIAIDERRGDEVKCEPRGEEPLCPGNDIRGDDPRGDTAERGETLGEWKRGETMPKLLLAVMLLRDGEYIWSHLTTSFSIDRARDAYFSVLNDSSALKFVGDMFTNIRVFAVPPRLSCISIVSL